MKYKFYLGIDVSKGYADFTILDENEKIVENNFRGENHTDFLDIPLKQQT